MTLIQRGTTWHLRRNVPRRFKAVEDRSEIYVTLRTDSEAEAKVKADLVWDQHIAMWEARLAGDTTDAENAFAAAQKIASLRGFRYLSAKNVEALPRAEFLDRWETAIENPKDSEAILGNIDEPPVTVQRALDLYWGLAADKTFGKSDDQIRRWRNPRKKAIKNFIGVVGNRKLSEITADDMLAFRDWWIARIQEAGKSQNSANKDIIHLSDVLKTVNRMKRLGLSLPLGDLSIKEPPRKTRLPFSIDWIRDKFIRPDALGGLNIEARLILQTMINTGARPSEIAALREPTIRLAANVPHISIEADGRQLKTARAARIIPLVGVSLEAMRQAPDGFPRYQTSSATLSGTVNKYLRENGLLETEAHTLYGLRHSFEDRMLAAGIDERIRRDLMGHALTREQYGAGASLEHMARELERVAV